MKFKIEYIPGVILGGLLFLLGLILASGLIFALIKIWELIL